MLLWLDTVVILSETSGMVYFLTSAVLFLWFSLLDEARLGDKVLEYLTCIKYWKRNGHISLFTPSDDT